MIVGRSHAGWRERNRPWVNGSSLGGRPGRGRGVNPVIEDSSSHLKRANQGTGDSVSPEDLADTGCLPRAPVSEPIADRGTSTRESEKPESQPDSGPDRPIRDPQQTVISKRPPASLPVFDRAATPFELGRTLEGEQLDHFRLEEFVGGGGMGAVFRATDTKLGRAVAVKVVSRSRTGDEALRRFRNEAQSAARLDHPNIARVYYVGEDKGWDYIVFEYIEGVNVRDLVDQVGALSIPDTMSYSVQIAEALDHAARREVIHRDIKPSNILIMADGRAKLVDMGLARLHQVESTSDDLTESGVTLGTFDYISPEQASDPRAADVRSDLYSLGCTMYFMLTGQPPFPDGTMLQKLLKHSSVEPPDPRELRPDLPEELARIVGRLLAKAPADRYQRPRELIAELVVLADQLDISGIHPIGPIWTAADLRPRRPWERHLPWLVPFAVLLVAVVLMQFGARLESSNTLPPAKIVTAPAAPSDRVPKPASKPVSVALPTAPTPGGPALPRPARHGDSDNTSAPRSTPTEPERHAETPAAGSPAATPESQTRERQTPDTPAKDPTGTRSNGTDTQGAAENAAPASGGADTARAFPPEGAAETADDPIASAPTPVIVVADENVELPAGWRYAATLPDALRSAAEATQAVQIELRFDGPRVLQPLRLDLHGAPRQELTIHAAAGYTPVIKFQPSADRSDSTSHVAMVDVVGGHLTWIGVQFQFVIPASTSSDSTVWSLFGLHGIDRIELRNCALTIRAPEPAATLSTRTVAFFEFPVPSLAPGIRGDTVALADTTPTIWMERCVARGQATLVRADRAVPFLLFWDQGLFISTERLVELGGTSVEPRWEHGRATLFFQRLLAAADQGICLTKTDTAAPYSLGLATNCYDCLFVTQKNNESTPPLFNMCSTSSPSDDAVLLSVGGNNNYYKNTQLVLRIRSVNAPDEVREFTFNDLKQLGEVAWFHEKDPQPATMFNWETRTRSVDRQTLNDFRPAADQDGTVHRILGISADELPQPLDIDLSADSPGVRTDTSTAPGRLAAPGDFR